MAADKVWNDERRLESWAGEVRVNLIRIVALTAFYGYHLLNVFLLRHDPSAGGDFHLRVTIIVAAWALAAFLLHRFLSRRQLPPTLPFVASAWDLCLLTLLLATTEGGVRSPLLILYFLIIAATPLRLSLPLVVATTLGALAAYLLLLGQYVFVVVGAERYYDPTFTERIPRTHEVIFILALAVAGLLAGQSVRQARRLVRGYPVVVER